MLKDKLKLKKEFQKRCRADGGFTLIEMLVAMTIFLVIISVVLNIFVTGLGGGQRLFGQQDILDAGRFIMESMSKEIRMSKIDQGNGGPYSSITVWPESKTGQSFVYSFVNDSINRDGSSLNPDKIKITGQFYIVKNGTSQPRVVITMKIENKAAKSSQQVKLNLQTTVSSREYE